MVVVLLAISGHFYRVLRARGRRSYQIEPVDRPGCVRVVACFASLRRVVKMSASPMARQSLSQNIPTRNVTLGHVSELPHDYSSTPGGTIFSTTPGGQSGCGICSLWGFRHFLVPHFFIKCCFISSIIVFETVNELN